MKLHKLGLISAAAVLTTMVSAGAYTQPAPAPVIPTPVGNLDGIAFYVGGALSSLGGSARNQSFTTGSATQFDYDATTAESNGDAVVVAADVANAYTMSTNSSDYTSTVNSLKFGGEGHLGAYIGIADGFGVSLEAFGVTRTSFNPVSTVTFADASTSSTVLEVSDLAASGDTPVANTITTGLDIAPKSLGYGFRIQPTVMLSDVFGMYASVGYGSQKWEGTLSNSEFFAINNHVTADTSTTTAAGVTGSAGQAISKNLSGMNYGIGSVFNIDETISVYTAIEVQKFSSYSLNAVGATIATTTAPLSVINTTGSTTVATSGSETVMYRGGDTLIVDNGTAGTPSSITMQLNTYSIGLDYAFA